MRRARLIYLSILCFTFTIVFNTTGHPIETNNDESKLDMKDEVHFPNGTVMGKYVYTDNEGNPVHVNYYADNSSYGVELKSVKIIESPSTETAIWPANSSFDILKPLESISLQAANENHKEKSKLKPLDGSKQKMVTPLETFDVFYKKEVSMPQKVCGEDNVKIYLNKEKRKTRNVVNDYKDQEYCDQF